MKLHFNTLIKYFIPLVILLNSAFAEQLENSFLFCLKPEISLLQISRVGNDLQVDLDELNEFFGANQITDIESWMPAATDRDRDGDIYLNRIYRLYLDESRQLSLNQTIQNLQSFPFILYAEPEYSRKPLYTTNDPSYASQCSMPAVKADHAWDFWDIPNEMPGSGEVLLASVDTGVDYTHPDLIANIWVNQDEIPSFIYEIGVDTNNDGVLSAPEIADFMATQSDLNEDGNVNFIDALQEGSPFLDGIDNDGNGYVDDIIGWDASGKWGTPDPDPFPKTGIANNSTWAHGTHVAGILAATADNGVGIASTAFNARIISVKTSRDGPTTDEPGIHSGYQGITYAAKAGHTDTNGNGDWDLGESFAIINNSWGGGGFSSSENSTINNAVNNYGAVILSAAGNGYDSGGEEYGTHYPSSYENGISVCAIGCSGNWGHWATYHPTVDLASPGESILSTIIGGGYEAWMGSSMASPNAASVIGLLAAYFPDWSNHQLRARVEESADPFIYDLNPNYIDCNGSSGENCLGSGMVDAFKAIGLDFAPYIIIEDFSFSELDGDEDGVVNPGERISINLSLENVAGWAAADNVQAVLSSDEPGVTIIQGNGEFGSIASGSTAVNTAELFEVEFASDAELGDLIFQLTVTAQGDGNYSFENVIDFEILLSINQVGFPVFTAELKASPLLIDLDNDGDNEIIIADVNGFIHILNADGTEQDDDTFPFDTGDDIWGSPAAADLDNDGNIDFVVTSKSKHIYIFDKDGLKTDYNADRYLLGTPAIGNLDSDDELEIVVASYSSPTSSNLIFAINPDGSDVPGFPYELGEKVKVGVALADFNGNGKDDIVVGTDSDNLHLIYDDGTEAPGFPFQAGDKIQAAPSVLNISGNKIILFGCNDDNFYAVNEDGSLRFTVPTGNKVLSSPAFVDNDGGLAIIFGSDDGNLYMVDANGGTIGDYPLSLENIMSGSVVAADLDGDGEAELVLTTQSGKVLALHLDGSQYTHFPIVNEFSFVSTPMVVNLDDDDDLEILAGSTSNLLGIDTKDSGSLAGYWSTYRGNNQRTGYYETELLAVNDQQLPGDFVLHQAFPNPFNPVTTISYEIPLMSRVELTIYNLNGKVLEQISSGIQSPGYYQVQWNAAGYASGMYLMRLNAKLDDGRESFQKVQKLLLIK